jgi:leucine-zipper-like transcriptional regulator 1
VFSGYSGRTVLNDFYRFQLQPIGIPAPGLCSDLALLVNNPHTMTDVQFACGTDGTIVHAHAAILVARSEFFRALLTGRLREGSNRGTSNNNNDQPIPLPHVDAPVFIKVMEYVYTDSIDPKATVPPPAANNDNNNNSSGSDAAASMTTWSSSVASPLGLSVALLVASEHFLLHRLKAIAEEWIMSEISEDTVIPVLLASHQHNAVSLKEVCLDFVQDNLNECGAALDELKSEPDLLLELLRRQPRQMGLLPMPQQLPPHQPR